MVDAAVGVRVALDGPCQMTGGMKLPGYPPTVVAVLSAEGKADFLDQPDDEPREGEQLFLYRFSGIGFIDYRGGPHRQKSGKYGFYSLVPDGIYRCPDCELFFSSPPPWPFERCSHWKSGFHRMPDDVVPPPIMEFHGG